MTTFDTNPSFSAFFLYKLGKLISRRQARSTRTRGMGELEATRTRVLFLATVRLLLHIAGFSGLTIAGFSWSFIAGMVVASISCFVMSTLFTSGDNADRGTQ